MTDDQNDDPLNPDQRARAEALRVARDITLRRSGLASSEVAASVHDLVDLALYILDGKLPWSDIYAPAKDEGDDDDA